MEQRRHDSTLEACPHLPLPGAPLRASAMKRFGGERGEAFYRGALETAQSLWLQGLPAQALLQLNRALGAELSGAEAALIRWPLPYAAAAWIMRHRREGQFIGNPRRHYQHLATRMVEPRRQQRVARAWACWYLSRLVFPDCPADDVQIREQQVVEPGPGAIRELLERHGIEGEAALWDAVASSCRPA
ncbi:MAG: hypothetical protein ACC661_02180 [Verrucomicrobiales bacterium]